MRLAIILSIAILGFSCSEKSAPVATESEQVKPDKTAEGTVDYVSLKYTSATVVDMTELDGCGFMLKMENGKKLQPSPALAKEFQVKDMPVWIKFQIKKGAAGICMSGQIVTLTEIEKR